MTMDLTDRIAEALSRAQRVVALTGAGISAESGISTFRGQGKVDTGYDPDKFATLEHFQKDPSYYWSFFKAYRYPITCKAKPNPGHVALADLEQQGKLRCLITQNVDNLHQVAGSINVVELHGNALRGSCWQCGKGFSAAWIYEELGNKPVPLCACGGIIRPSVVFFNEALPPDALKTGFDESARCDFMIVVGTSLIVYPAAHMPLMAKQRGAKLLIINRDPTPLDRDADFVLHEPSGVCLPRIVSRMAA
jgi:NAD-dependent deacetylase